MAVVKYLQLEYGRDYNVGFVGRLIEYYDQKYHLFPKIDTYWTATGEKLHQIYYVRTYHDNLCDISNIDPMTLCFKIKKEFLAPNKLEDNLDIVIDLFNKINALMCVLCKNKIKNIMIKPCEHICLCHDCLKTRTTCPICKCIITASEKAI